MRLLKSLLAFIFIFTLLLLPVINQESQPAFSAQNTWTLTTKTQFTGGYGQSVVGTEDIMCVLRQYNPNQRFDFACYSVDDQGKLLLKSNLGRPGDRETPPDFKNGTALVWDSATKDQIYALLGGAYSDTGLQSRKFFYQYELSTDKWIELAETPGEQGAGDALTFVLMKNNQKGYSHYIYALTGAAQSQRTGAQSHFSAYSITERKWTDLPTLWGCTDDGVSLAWTGKKFIYAIRGSDCRDEESDDFARFNISTHEWEELDPVPTTVNDGGSLIWDHNNFLYAINGGGEKPSEGGTEFYRYNLVTQKWETDLPNLPCAIGRYNGNRIAIIKGYLYYWQGSASTWPCGAKSIQRIIF